MRKVVKLRYCQISGAASENHGAREALCVYHTVDYEYLVYPKV